MITTWDKYQPHFRKLEFACKHCGHCEMDEDFMDALLRLRVKFGRPMIITSGYRCPEYNDKVSSTGRNGPHTTGMAADILVSGTEARILLELAHEFPRIGIHQKGDHSGRYIHLDSLPKPGWVWTY